MPEPADHPEHSHEPSPEPSPQPSHEPSHASRVRRSFGPVVLLGLLAGTLGAVAGNKPWAAGTGRAAQVSDLAVSADAAQMPVAGALALVVLASWGVVLVSRGRVRRAIAVLGALAALGVLVSVVLGFGSVPDALRAGFAEIGLADPGIRRTGWYWTAAVAAVLSLVATALAVRLVPYWPEMGTRYDAPGAQEPAPVVKPEDQSSLDLWRAMDEGRDPTA
jgi:uncharacterized membrane protein (TIGR02234 family)